MIENVLPIFEKEYNIKIKNSRPFRGGMLLNTDSGKKFAKQCFYSQERVLFIQAVKNHLSNKGFSLIDPYVLTSEGLPYIRNDQGLFTLATYIDGRECDFDKDTDVETATINLAKMHRCGKGFVVPANCITHNQLGKIPKHFSKRLDEIRKLRKKAERERKNFDYLFLENYEYFYKLGKESLENIYISKYSKLVEKAKHQGELCHHDYSFQNIIFKDKKVYTINFDLCSIELKIYDLVNLIRRKMRKSNWDIKHAKNILDCYKEYEPLSQDELYVVKIMLQFPQKFWRVVNKYYNSKRSWTQKSYINRLEEVVKEKEYHKEFIDEFDSII